MGLDNPLHIVFLVVILLLIFGARRLPEIGRSLGTGMREFKSSVTGEDQDQAEPVQTLPSAPPVVPAAAQAQQVANQAAPAAQPVQQAPYSAS